MKDLTDYFGSSPKAESPSLETTKDITNIKADKDELEVQKTYDIPKGRKKKRKKRKTSDPAVKNITDLLSGSLTIVSPNTSGRESKPKKECVVIEDTAEDKLLPIKTKQVVVREQECNGCILSEEEVSQVIDCNKEQGECSKMKNKLNAFQFMMESRNKSIGQNSPGREWSHDDDSVDKKQDKEVLSVRKNLLQNWCDKKGAIKRKREEEEIEETINHKLQKRSKRLKKLLHVDSSKDVIKRRKRRIKRVSSSSSEDSKDIVLLEMSSNRTINSPQLDLIEENAQNSICNQSKAKETKQGLLTCFGVVHKSKESETINRKIKNGKVKELVNENIENLKVKRKILKSNSCTTKTINKSSKIAAAEHSEKSSIEKLKSKKENKPVYKENVEKAKTPKTPIQKSKDEDDNFTPRSTKSWRMKIKISEQQLEKEQSLTKTEERRSLRVKKIQNYSMLFVDENSSDGDIVAPQKNNMRNLKAVDVVYLDDSDEKKKEAKPMKVAPVFTKSTPKPKLAPEIIEARKQFLMSGIPDSLKRTMEKQQSIEDREYDVFPSISHIQQKCESEFWNLPKPQLDLKCYSPLKVKESMVCANITNSHVNNMMNIKREVEKVDKLKTLLNKIKSDNPNYPVYKSFRLIYEKSGKTVEKKVECKKNKKNHKSIEIVTTTKPETEHAMWTDKYKPKCSDDILGNSEAVKNLKKWLEFWKNCSEEIDAKKKKRLEYSSESEFDTTDCDSRDSTRLPGNTIIVGGPCGTGKSTAVYAICNELDFNVIELNASSKRTGKRLLQELQEATQSHQVRKKEKNLQNFLTEKPETKEPRKKMCVLLIEDIDIVFEQDDGFVSALNQLVSTSKRPVIFTTTDTSPVFVQKFISQYEYISFLPLSSRSLAIWLQIVCLVEGLFVNPSEIGSILAYNKGDARKTLLQLQYWVQSGGQIVRDELPLKMKTTISTTEKKLLDDEQEPRLDDSSVSREVFEHSDCFRSFEIFKHHKSYRIPYYINLGFLWWNIPNILGIQSFSDERICRYKNVNAKIEDKQSQNKVPTQNKKLSSIECRKLHVLSKLYDSLVFTDVSFRAVNYSDGLEPAVKNYSSEIRDSLEIGEIMDSFNGCKDFVHELTHSLVNGYVEEFCSIQRNESVLNIGVPEKVERRWREKVHACEDVFRDALPLSTLVERRSIALDYMPLLRDISRSESRRAAGNTKRGNRFRNYLRSLGINYNDNTLKLACNILTDDF